MEELDFTRGLIEIQTKRIAELEKSLFHSDAKGSRKEDNLTHGDGGLE